VKSQQQLQNDGQVQEIDIDNPEEDTSEEEFHGFDDFWFCLVLCHLFYFLTEFRLFCFQFLQFFSLVLKK
jgi:hypothetical protein